jgi:hypothetical protein
MGKTAQPTRRQARTNGASGRQSRRKFWVTSSAGAAVIAGAATIVAAAVTGAFNMAQTSGSGSTPVASQSGSPAPSQSGSPAPSQSGSPAPSQSGSPAPSQSGSPAPSQSVLPHSRIAGDQATFIRDVTFPDNSTVRPGQQFTKKWELKNTGAVRWIDRYLIPEGLSTGNCSYPARIRIPATDPGHTVVISVPVTAESTPGLCYVTWKMASASGDLYFPGYLGIWFEVKVSKPNPHPFATPS